MTIGDDDKPVHVHVDRNTPVHVHLKKKKKGKNKGAPTAVEERLRARDRRMTGILTKPSGRSSRKGTRSASPPFIPAPAKTTRGRSPLRWENQTHALDVSPPSRNGGLRMEDLSSSEEDEVYGRMRNYENKISSLMSEVGTLKNEADLQKTLRDVEKKDKQISASRKILEDQERELKEYKKELKSTV
ncbi:outer dense fiber protein 2-like, partial [Actinia tenebrosa]|uniref:Outer dense fiber protein 2-like n=1 Tax=Actinia tenebrosa TaxID=6105 RepID=A0A6P8IX20_ACTTE